MKNKLKILFLLLCTILLCAGCGNEKTADFQPVEPPENGWTMEALMNATYLYDSQLKYPLTLKDLGENFSIDDSEKVELKDKVTVQLKYGEKNVCCVTYYQNDVEENYEDAEIFLMYFHKLYTDEPDRISVNGVTLGSSLTEVKEMLGQPDSKEIAYHYENSENGKTLVSVGFNQFDESNLVTAINFFMKNG